MLEIPWESDPISNEDLLQPGPVGDYLEVVDYDPASECFYEPVDLNRIMVRSRLREHLDCLKGRFLDLIGDCEIHENVGTDYAFRFFVDKSVWSKVLVGLNKDVDYDNFKSEVARFRGRDAYEHSLHDVWSVMNEIQK